MNDYTYWGKSFIFNYSLYPNPDPKLFFNHTHEQYELLYFMSGNARFWVEGNPYQLKPHDIIIFNIGEAHRLEISNTVPYERIDINFGKNFFDNNPDYAPLLEPFFSRPLGQHNLFHSEEFSDNFYKRCLSKMMVHSENTDLQILSNLNALLNELYTAFVKRQKEPELSHRLSSQIINYINENISQDITPESIAENFFISRSHLYSVFRKATGTSVRQYITVKRLLLARELLADGNHPSQVCSMCGFGDYSSFFRAYKAKFGTSPSKNLKNPSSHENIEIPI